MGGKSGRQKTRAPARVPVPWACHNAGSLRHTRADADGSVVRIANASKPAGPYLIASKQSWWNLNPATCWQEVRARVCACARGSASSAVHTWRWLGQLRPQPPPTTPPCLPLCPPPPRLHLQPRFNNPWICPKVEGQDVARLDMRVLNAAGQSPFTASFGTEARTAARWLPDQLAG